MTQHVKPISLAEAARMKGCSRAAVTQAVKRGALASAMLPGGRLDRGHAAFLAWLGEGGKTTAQQDAPKPAKDPTGARRRTAASKAPAPLKKPKGAEAAQDEVPPGEPWPPPDGHGSDQDLAELAAALRPLVSRFGTTTEFGDWLDRLKRIEEIREKRLKNRETEGTLIARELVKTHLFGAIEAANRRLLTDSPKTVARRIYALAKSDATMEEAEATVRELVSSQLRVVKATAVRILKEPSETRAETAA